MKKYKRIYIKVVSWIGLIGAVILIVLYALLALISKQLIPLFLSIPFIGSLLYSKWTLELLNETKGKK